MDERPNWDAHFFLYLPQPQRMIDSLLIYIKYIEILLIIVNRILSIWKQERQNSQLCSMPAPLTSSNDNGRHSINRSKWVWRVSIMQPLCQDMGYKYLMKCLLQSRLSWMGMQHGDVGIEQRDVYVKEGSSPMETWLYTRGNVITRATKHGMELTTKIASEVWYKFKRFFHVICYKWMKTKLKGTKHQAG